MKGKGKYISSILYDNKDIPSYILTDVNKDNTKIFVELGELTTPMILKAETKIFNPVYSIENKTLSFLTESFSGNKVEIEIISPVSLKNMLNNGTEISLYKQKKLDDGNIKLHLSFIQDSKGNNMKLSFN